MPFINSKISVALNEAQEQEIKSRLGRAITAIPGKSESWLMVGFEPEYKLYFRGSKDQPMAMVEVSVYGSENPSAFSKLTGEICRIFEDVLGIAPDHVYVKYQAVANWGRPHVHPLHRHHRLGLERRQFLITKERIKALLVKYKNESAFIFLFGRFCRMSVACPWKMI